MTIIPENLTLKKSLPIPDVDIKEEILYSVNSSFHNISVIKSTVGTFLKYQDTLQAGFINTVDYKGNLPYVNYFLIPYLMNKNIKDVLLVGLGSGAIINRYNELFNLKRVDIVDIEENILDIAQRYFSFQMNEKFNFHLQDALIYLKTTKKKYDLIVVDVAGNEGIDERFCEIEYLTTIKNHLKKDGIFVSNMPSSRDIFNKKNKFFHALYEKYKMVFEYINIYNGETSNKVFYKAFFNTDKVIFDITNLILISSSKNFEISTNCEKCPSCLSF